MKDNDEMRNYISNNNEDYKVKYYDLYSIINYINEIIKKIELENVFSSEFNKFFKEIFINFDYIGKWNINFLLKNGYIEKKISKLINYEILTKDYINKYREIIWTLLIKNSYLIYVITSNNYCISEVRKLKIKIKDVGKLIIKIIL